MSTLPRKFPFNTFTASVAGALLAVAAIALSSAANQPPRVDQAARVARGEYLVTLGSCNDCHTPWKFNPQTHAPEPDMSLMLAGHPQGAPEPEGTVGPHDMALIGPTFTAFKLPFGTVYSRNLTPDKATGLGEWAEEMFIRALRSGRHMGGNGRPILPPMPWNMITVATDEDLRSIFAYLRTIPPIVNDAPEPKVPDEVQAGIAKVNDGLAAHMQQVREARDEKLVARAR